MSTNPRRSSPVYERSTMLTLKSILAPALLACACLFTPGIAAEGETAPPAEAAQTDVKPFPLKFCVTCGDDITPENQAEFVTKVHKGREVKLCKGCVKMFNADPDGYLKQVDKSIKTGEPVKSGH